jgi:hypothetical protein
MTDDEISALARGMAPYIRERVADTVCKSMIVSPELAEQIASAVRLLHEQPEPMKRVETPISLPKITSIKRDEQGNFVPAYDEIKA